MLEITEALLEEFKAEPGYWDIILDDDYTQPDTCIIVHDIQTEEEAEAFFRAHFREFVGSIADDDFRYITFYARPSNKEDFDAFYAKDYNKGLLDKVEGYLKTWDYKSQLAKEQKEEQEYRQKQINDALDSANHISFSVTSASPESYYINRDAANIDELIEVLQEIKATSNEVITKITTTTK